VYRDENLTPAQWEIIGELCDLTAARVREGGAPTAVEAARVFRALRDILGDGHPSVRERREYLRATAPANDLAEEILDVLDPWWSEEPERLALDRNG
jgi:hypothetical protein